MLVNIDFDGVLIPNYFEKQLVEVGAQEGLPSRISQFDDNVFEWYVKMVRTSPLAPLNTELLQLFADNQDIFTLRLWTNRNQELKKRTIENLGDWKGLFDSFQFYSGKKSQSQVEGIVIDNSHKYLGCGELGIHYEWR